MNIDRKLIKKLLKEQKIETPSWGYSDSGTRFHVFKQKSAARNIRERLKDAAQVQKFTGICPTVALHIPWDKVDNWEDIKEFTAELGLKIGAINPNLFEDDDYMLGSICSPYPEVRKKAINHIKECIQIAYMLGSDIISLWVPDGTNYPGQDNFIERKHRMEQALGEVYSALGEGKRLLLEYKFFEPAFYHTDIFDWGSSYVLCKKLGEKAQVLVDLGHHPKGTNIEHIVAFLLDEGKLGGFHFNNKKYADDDLVVGSINPYELFLIYHELVSASLCESTVETSQRVTYMIDQSHNIKNKIEATIQSVINIQEAYAKALLVDRELLYNLQKEGRVLDAEECVKDAFRTDVRPLLKEVREEMGIDPDPLSAFRKSGYLEIRGQATFL